MPTTGERLEGVYYIVAFIGALSFCLTGPFAAIIARSLREYWILSAPTLAYQAVAYSGSIVPVFIRGVWTSRDTWAECVLAAILGTIGYLWYYVLVRRLGNPKPLAMAFRAVCLAVISFAIIAFLALKS
jgi:drug/metabolite transporter (DMT)-like permease